MVVRTPICLACGTILRTNWTHCGNCGAPIPKETKEVKPGQCPKCKLENGPVAIFCGNCGTKL